jgi:hypothetical protein
VLYDEAMRTKASSRAKLLPPPCRAKPVVDADLERFLVDYHAEVKAKLQKARQSIARGRVKPLEPLPTLLRDARGHAKAAR